MERIAALDEVPPGGRKSVWIDDIPALLLRSGADYFAIEDVCSHDGQPLTDGPMQAGQITCPRHGARFDLKTGKPMCMPATAPIQVFAVERRSDGIYAGVAQTAPQVTTSPVTNPVPTVAAPATPTTTTDGGTEPAELDDGAILESLRQVIDPELMINIVDLGLVYAINHGEQRVQVDMTLTSPACPAGPQIVQQAKMVLEKLPGVTEAQIKLTMSPPWTPERMTDEARDQLGIF